LALCQDLKLSYGSVNIFVQFYFVDSRSDYVMCPLE